MTAPCGVVQGGGAVGILGVHELAPILGEGEQHLGHVAISALGCPKKGRHARIVMRVEQLIHDRRLESLEHVLERPHALPSLRCEPHGVLEPLHLHLLELLPRVEGLARRSVHKGAHRSLKGMRSPRNVLQLLNHLELRAPLGRHARKGLALPLGTLLRLHHLLVPRVQHGDQLGILEHAHATAHLLHHCGELGEDFEPAPLGASLGGVLGSDLLETSFGRDPLLPPVHPRVEDDLLRRVEQRADRQLHAMPREYGGHRVGMPRVPAQVCLAVHEVVERALNVAPVLDDFLRRVRPE